MFVLVKRMTIIPAISDFDRQLWSEWVGECGIDFMTVFAPQIFTLPDGWSRMRLFTFALGQGPLPGNPGTEFHLAAAHW
jgi:hypothetical protein